MGLRASTVRYEIKTYNQKTDLPAWSTTRDQKLKRNNDKKIKQTDGHNKSEKLSRGKVPEVFRTVPLSMTLSDLESKFQGHVIFNVK